MIKDLIIKEKRNPIAPKIMIPIAETFETCSNSSLEGFFITLQTLLHFTKKDFVVCSAFIK